MFFVLIGIGDMSIIQTSTGYKVRAQKPKIGLAYYQLALFLRLNSRVIKLFQTI
jgi:hypothetical protein